MNIMTMWGICSLEIGCDVITYVSTQRRIVRFMLEGLFDVGYSIWAIDEVLISKNIAEAMEWT